jgi:hypothetical protein
VIAALAATLLGCGTGSGPTEDGLGKAQTALDKALDAWTRSESPEGFSVDDPDWKAGYRLLSFLTAETNYVDQRSDQVRCRVALTLADKQGKRSDKDVFYIVKLADRITVAREPAKMKVP